MTVGDQSRQTARKATKRQETRNITAVSSVNARATGREKAVSVYQFRLALSLSKHLFGSRDGARISLSYLNSPGSSDRASFV